ncbi:PREDICTED: receptor-type tyrosine-protein phosphatase alpha-like [Rhagoletis zephyria]|uniref:receptor-type tyrosine-protein phosphatase alpha-like n=1 Tax=Rhagoletis zephyria TaxID=28612 RepID=UPI00081193D3|nr:PREDICTED: receptor-type tyrosine-protein phosphatase alpha-like [Rhagoletis zephyria]
MRNYFGSGQLQSYLIFWRKEDNRKLIKARYFVEEDGSTSFEPKSNVIQVSELLTTVPKLLEGDALKAEYNYVPRSQMFSWNQAKLPEHKTKNRYGNLLPYDNTRVILKKESPGDTDYINANFIDGYKKAGRYIAMQGPIDATIEDFWRCVWQFKCHQIVILTNLEESGKSKCEKYWPEMSQFYGKIKVSMTKTELFADYTIRHFLLERDHDSLVVVQYHFLSWPDHMVPMYACTLISFINCIRSSSLYQEDNSPMVVHCSAGIGRTGAFIVIDSMLRMAEKEKKIDVFGHFCKVRQQRINMVEKFAQYRFVYQVLLEALSHDPTDISCIDFATYLDRQTKGSDKTCLLYKQYEILNTMSLCKLPSEVCKFGMVNYQFNRRADVVPPDYARVILPNLNDYVNAVYVNGYRKQDAYIVTQIPFENNRQQFWKMIASTQANLIVLLNEASGDEQVYWPSSVNQRLVVDDELSVSLQKEDLSQHIIVRTFVLKPAETIVKQVQLRGFQSLLGKYSPTASSYSLIELKEKLDAGNMAGSSAPLVVQCTDGVQLSGLFCAADFIFERIKEEQQIDVFLAVQKIRANRPQFITSYWAKKCNVLAYFEAIKALVGNKNKQNIIGCKRRIAHSVIKNTLQQQQS